MTGYYKTWFFRYLNATNETRQASINHWTKCHIENMASGRDDLVLFSGKMLGAALLAEKFLQFKTKSGTINNPVLVGKNI